MGQYLSQTGGTSAAGDLTNAIGNTRLSLLCPATNGTVSTSVVTWVVNMAEAEVNSILGPGFSVPIATASVTNVVKRCACDIAVHFAYKRSTEFRTQDGKTPVAADYDDARKTLTDIRNGARTLGSTAASSKTGIVGGTVYASTQYFIVEASEATTTGPTGGW
jgi:phage gp36-like protein